MHDRNTYSERWMHGNLSSDRSTDVFFNVFILKMDFCGFYWDMKVDKKNKERKNK